MSDKKVPDRKAQKFAMGGPAKIRRDEMTPDGKPKRPKRGCKAACS